MNPVVTSWYLSGVFALMLVLSSAITYAPKAKRFAIVLTCGLAFGALMFAAVAILLRSLGRRQPSPRILSSATFRIAYTLLAILITLVCALFIGV
jgi:ABC-type Na+ efflux pump permease subunit